MKVLHIHLDGLDQNGGRELLRIKRSKGMSMSMRNGRRVIERMKERSSN